MHLYKAVMDKLTFYINPEIFKAEHNEEEKVDKKQEDNVTPIGNERVNTEYEQQRKSGQQTGKVELSAAMESAMKKFYNKKQEEKKVPRLIADTDAELG